MTRDLGPFMGGKTYQLKSRLLISTRKEEEEVEKEKREREKKK
jgi:hypothetical protein